MEIDTHGQNYILHIFIRHKKFSYPQSNVIPKELTYSRGAFLNERGQGLAEYLIIVVVIALAVLFGIRYFGDSVTNQFQNATGQITNIKDGDNALAPGSSDTSGSSRRDSERSAGDEEVSLDSSTDTDVSSDDNLGGDGGGGGDAGGGGDNLDSLRAKPVGADDSEVINDLEIDWGMILTLAALVVAGGVYAVLRMAPKKKKQSKKDKAEAKKAKKSKPSSEAGQAMVEFVLVAITFLFAILGVIQLAMVLNAYALVRYAAYNSARAAIVHANEPVVLREKMHEAARLSLLATFPSHGRADHIRGLMENYTAAKETDQDASLTFFNEPITSTEIVDNSGLPSGAVVTFDDFTEGSDAVITVKVEHHYELVIPLVNRILFFVYTKFRSGEGYSGQSLDKMSAETHKLRSVGEFRDIEYRIPLVAHYTMRLQSDYTVE